MPEAWHSLYLRGDNAAAVATSLLDTLERHGYQRYDPFPGGKGTPPGLKTMIKHFVAPPLDGWVRVLGEPDTGVLPDLSAASTLLHGWLTNTDSGIDVYRDGHVDSDGLAAFLRAGKSIDDLTRAREGTLPTVFPASAGNAASLIPDDVQQLARDHNVNPDQANKMIDRLTSRLFGKMDRASGGQASALQAEARALAMGGNRVDWNSAAARRLLALASVLDLPSNWREPDFETVREAYQAARYLRKNPRAQLMADEQAALKRWPDAAEYEAVYVGK